MSGFEKASTSISRASFTPAPLSSSFHVPTSEPSMRGGQYRDQSHMDVGVNGACCVRVYMLACVPVRASPPMSNEKGVRSALAGIV